MARVVVLTFSDNKAAEQFIKRLDVAQEEPKLGELHKWETQAYDLGLILAAHATAEAVLARPVLACECPGNHKGEYGKSPVFGWLVHKTCGRPEKVLVDRYLDNLTISGGTNLLSKIRSRKKVMKEATKPTAGDSSSTEDG